MPIKKNNELIDHLSLVILFFSKHFTKKFQIHSQIRNLNSKPSTESFQIQTPFTDEKKSAFSRHFTIRRWRRHVTGDAGPNLGQHSL